MHLKINQKDKTPVYYQLVFQIKLQILRGILRPGERIPTVRDIAVELMINPV